MRVAQRQTALSASVPAPIGGWNKRDPEANMDPTDALILDNWFPRTADVLMRPGYTDWVTGLPSQVNSLMAYAGPASSKLFAASSTSIYDVTTSGVVGAAVKTGLTSTKFNYVNFRTSGGQYLWAVNGADLALLYDGSTWNNPSVTGLSGSLTTADFSHINIWKQRIFLVQKNSMSVWYLGVNSISGAASEINFGSLFKAGGKIVATATWTVDGGYGMDDNLVIITSKGEIAVYHGTDPSSANTFSLVGVYQVGAPISDKCFVKYAGDLIMTTLDGFLPMSAALQSTRVDNRTAVSDKISGAVSDAAINYQNNFGWHPVLFSKQDALIFNIPVTEGVESHQYVMNVITGSWCRFKGWNANCFELLNDNLYFGTNGKVCKAWDGAADGSTAIMSEVKTAFNYFGVRGRNKQFRMARPIFTASEPPAPSFGLNVDFIDQDVTSAISATNPFGVWDSGVWDLALWGGNATFRDWQGVNGIGMCAALRMKISSTTITLSWSATDWVYAAGGAL